MRHHTRAHVATPGCGSPGSGTYAGFWVRYPQPHTPTPGPEETQRHSPGDTTTLKRRQEAHTPHGHAPGSRSGSATAGACGEDGVHRGDFCAVPLELTDSDTGSVGITRYSARPPVGAAPRPREVNSAGCLVGSPLIKRALYGVPRARTPPLPPRPLSTTGHLSLGLGSPEP